MTIGNGQACRANKTMYGYVAKRLDADSSKDAANLDIVGRTRQCISNPVGDIVPESPRTIRTAIPSDDRRHASVFELFQNRPAKCQLRTAANCRSRLAGKKTHVVSPKVDREPVLFKGEDRL